MANTPNANGVWRTIRGARVFIEDGVITKGPRVLRGKGLAEAEKEATVWSDHTDSGDIVFTRTRSGSYKLSWKVGERKFTTTFMEADSGRYREYELTFAEQTGPGSATYKLTNKGDAHAVFSQVGKQVSAFIDQKKPWAITFTADTTEPSRVKFYEFLTKRTDKLYPDFMGATTGTEPGGFRGVPDQERYYLVNRERAKYLGGKKGKTIGWGDEEDDELIDEITIISNEEPEPARIIADNEPMLTEEQLAPKTVRFE